MIILTNIELMEHWIKSSNDDHKAMTDLYNTKNYNWALFIGHLVIEKLLKGLYAKLNKQEPYAPKIHNLLALSQKCNLDIDDKKIESLSRITRFNMSARYDDVKKEFYELCTEEYAEEQIKVIEELIVWLKAELM